MASILKKHYLPHNFFTIVLFFCYLIFYIVKTDSNNVSEISAFFEDEDGGVEDTAAIDYPPYGKADFLSEVFIS
ncbi:MAG: hypothetical protein IJP97_06885 [Synergistaceae bacterium]|nr:hypothetical protein [Synergistaceae bacterium]